MFGARIFQFYYAIYLAFCLQSILLLFIVQKSFSTRDRCYLCNLCSYNLQLMWWERIQLLFWRIISCPICLICLIYSFTCNYICLVSTKYSVFHCLRRKLFEMPQQRGIRTVSIFSRLSFPSTNTYLTFSAVLFLSGLYYYYKVVIDSRLMLTSVISSNIPRFHTEFFHFRFRRLMKMRQIQLNS